MGQKQVPYPKSGWLMIGFENAIDKVIWVDLMNDIQLMISNLAGWSHNLVQQSISCTHS
jgi:hypothetical protein